MKYSVCVITELKVELDDKTLRATTKDRKHENVFQRVHNIQSKGR